MDPGGFGAHSVSSEPSKQSSSPSHLHVFKTHRLFAHLNSFGSQPFGLQRNSSDPSVQSLFPLQTASFGMQSPFEQVASDGEQAVGVRVGGGTHLSTVN